MESLPPSTTSWTEPHCAYLNTMARAYALRQDSYWFKPEWDFLNQAVKDAIVQEWIAKEDYEKARSVLLASFRMKFTGPMEGESEQEYKKRFRGTSKQRRALISRRVTETLDAWAKHMEKLPEVRNRCTHRISST